MNVAKSNANLQILQSQLRIVTSDTSGQVYL